MERWISLGDAEPCTDVGGHHIVVVYVRNWRSLWRRRYFARCLNPSCDLSVRVTDCEYTGTGMWSVGKHG